MGFIFIMKLSVCEQCGDPFDTTGYPICNDCRYDKTYIKLEKEHIQDKEDGRTIQNKSE